MTQKAEQILNKLREKDRRRRVLSRLNDPRHRDCLLDSLDRSTLDNGAAPIVNGDMTILDDINSLEQEHDQYMENLEGEKLGI